ncbi:hypothetical protein AVEN_56045-1 [Araneus ventricosus]|uniref:Uncharacterized protein n=1 Tax=Araneus ventricosus TaxID=182803 RepID=A0A4Y2DLQ4_ARAVE|nr:hypothetical protein AVEN_56045-1 [Araneus ventricosus]
MRGQIAQSANTHMMKIGSSVDCKEWWHEKCSSYEGNEHLYTTTAKFQSAYSWPHVLRTLTRHVGNFFHSFLESLFQLMGSAANDEDYTGDSPNGVEKEIEASNLLSKTASDLQEFERHPCEPMESF